VPDASIRNCATTSIVYVHAHDSPIIKTIHLTVNVMSTKVKLFIIKCGINQATYLPNIKWIIVITDFIYTAKRIFNSSSHPIKFIQQLSLINLGNSLNKITTISLNSRIVLVATIGISMLLLIKKQRNLISLLSSPDIMCCYRILKIEFT